jgi:hypothetical protein
MEKTMAREGGQPPKLSIHASLAALAGCDFCWHNHVVVIKESDYDYNTVVPHG